jgi:Na+/proline symporter
VPLLAVPSEAKKLRLARLVVVIAGLVAYGLALSSESVFALVEEASAFGGAGLAVITIFGLFSRFGGVRAGYAGLLAGMGVQLVLAYGLHAPHSYTWSLVASLAAFLLVGGAERALSPRDLEPERARAKRDEAEGTASSLKPKDRRPDPRPSSEL